MKTLLASAAVLCLGTGIGAPAYAEAVTYKFKTSGDGWRGRPWIGVVVVVDGNTVRPRHTEQTSAFSAVIGSWADYPAIAIRACKGASDSFKADECITSQGAEILIPEGQDPKAYGYEFKYRFGDSVKQDAFSF